MSKDPPRPSGPRAVPNESPADKSPRALNKALDTLDDLLAGSKGAPARQQPAPEPQPEPGPVADRDPHTLSLLDAVENDDAAEPEDADEAAPPGIADDIAYQQLADRLASELEVIVQTGVSEAMQQAGATIMARVKDHLDIMLPEILQELADIEARKID